MSFIHSRNIFHLLFVMPRGDRKSHDSWNLLDSIDSTSKDVKGGLVPVWIQHEKHHGVHTKNAHRLQSCNLTHNPLANSILNLLIWVESGSFSIAFFD